MRITQKNAQELLPLLHALAEGKQIQRRYLDVSQQPQHCYKWDDVDAVGVDVPLDRYRIKPTKPTLRPWKPEEVPVGALIRDKTIVFHNVAVTTILAVRGAWVHYIDPSTAKLTETICNKFDSDWEHSLDHGKTWHPCGVVE